jgi:hypothetical protein
MSFSLTASGKKGELPGKLEENFNTSYPEPAKGVTELVSVATDAVSSFATTSEDDGNYSVSISGHAKQSDSERDYLSVSISATS